MRLLCVKWNIPEAGGGGGGGTQVPKGYLLQTDIWSGSGERQNIRAVNSFESKNGIKMGGGQLQT